jgi:DNA-binding MarR family transcriptional regulator
MPQSASQSDTPEFRSNGSTGAEGQKCLRLSRSCHIFASAIRDFLHEDVLREVFPVTLTRTQFYVLKLMAHNGHHRASDVADLLGVSAPAATKNIDKLERLQLVVRAPFSGDRRATLLSISQEGRRVVQAYETAQAERVDSLLAEFRPEEIEQFCSLLERASTCLLRREPPNQECCLRCAGDFDGNCPVRQLRGRCPYEGVQRDGRDAPSTTP